MVMKKDGRKRDIKSKLVAAVCMLLVSCIMMVSSTYAWFTLSTAPEVTGITTAIGANGNLEMALIPGMKDATTAYATIAEAMAAIGNATGSLSAVEANTTWGNLVNLEDDSYGMDKITLYPAKLEATNNVIPDYYLSTPKYGADGRFSGLNQTALSAIYSNGAFGTTGFGVRAVGTSSGMSAMEMAYRSALAAGNNAMQSAIASSKSAVSTGGSKLASMAVTKATGTTTFSAADKTALVDAYDGILTAIGHIETALKNYLIADYLSSGAKNETNYAAAVTEMEALSLADLATYVGNTNLTTYVTTLNTMKTNATNSKTALNTLAPDAADGVSYTWGALDDHVKALADMDAMELNDYTMDHWMEKDTAGNYVHLGDLVGLMGNLEMTINADGSDTGYYAQLANFVDDFSTPATISGIQYNGISADNLKVTMNVYKATTVTTAYLPAAKSEATTYDSSVFSGGGSNLSDFYGYIVDLAFRTNAADSYLQLQTEGVDRIYSDNTANPTTMGGGSTMSFTLPADSDFATDRLSNLMSFVRVVFFDPSNSNTILGYARLDVSTAKITGSATEGWTVEMQLKMWDASIDADSDGTAEGGWATSQKIIDLVQNTATAVSAMVYLDGESLSNADIANENLTGTMNLQFSSSAELKPMEYGDLRKESTTTTGDSTVTATQMTAVTAPSSYTTVAAFTGDSIAMTIANTDGTETVTVGIGTSTYTAEYSSTSSAWIVTDIAETLAADTAVTVTVTEAAGG